MTKHTHQNSPAREAHDHSQAARLLAEWRAAVADRIAAFHAEPSKLSGDFEAASDRESRIARAAWAIPIADPAGLRLRAMIARDAVWPNFDDGAHRFERVLAGDEPEDDVVVGAFDERAVAELVKAVLWTSGAGKSAADEPEQPAGDAPDRPPLVTHMEDLIGRARDGVTTLYQIWMDRCGGLDFPDPDLAVSLKFCLDGVDALLEEAEKRIVAEIEAGRPPD